METKVCSKCKVEKPTIEFGKDKNSSTGYTYQCKECRNKAYNEYYRDNPNKVKERNQRNWQKRKDYYSSEEGIKSSRRAHLKRKFNISLEDYDELLKEQNNICAICNEEETCSRNNFLAVDHNHSNGSIRGLLCNNCNRAIGLLKDNLEILNNAIKYLKKYE